MQIDTREDMRKNITLQSSKSWSVYIWWGCFVLFSIITLGGFMGFGDQSLITLWLANPVMTLAALGLAVSDNTVVEFKYPASRELMVYKHKNGSLFVGSEDEVSLLLEMDEKEWEDVELIGKAEHFN